MYSLLIKLFTDYVSISSCIYQYLPVILRRQGEVQVTQPLFYPFTLKKSSRKQKVSTSHRGIFKHLELIKKNTFDR